MAIGLFGKLPARRDFIAVNVPRAFLTPWEAWLEAALVASQSELGDDWYAAYMGAQTWRFWLGPAIGGAAAVGAITPSRDGVGRAYPLTIVATGDFAPPDRDVRDDWFAAAEGVLLAATKPDCDYAKTLAALEAIPEPPAGWRDEATRSSPFAIPGGLLAHPTAAASPSTFSELRRSSPIEVAASSTCWWSTGVRAAEAVTTPDPSPVALVLDGLPRPELFAAMLTGNWPQSGAPGRSAGEVNG